MTNRNLHEATHLVEDFLIETPCPRTDDWKRLIDAHPEHAGDIADAAWAHSNTDKVSVTDGDLPLNDALFNATISHALNLVHQTPSALLGTAQRRVAEIQGPAVKKVAIEIGIGPYASLLSGVLVGRTLAPSRILSALGERFDIQLAALSELFRRAFTVSEVPAFKSTDGQPMLIVQPNTWEQSVRALNLSPEETDRLLKLSNEE